MVMAARAGDSKTVPFLKKKVSLFVIPAKLVLDPDRGAGIQA